MEGTYQSKWYNPFTVRKCGSLNEVLKRYKQYLYSNRELLNDIHELQGKVLGCWCKPNLCHGDILTELVNDPSLIQILLTEIDNPKPVGKNIILVI